MPAIIERPSPSFEPRPPGTRIDMLVLHYTGMETMEGALARLCDPAVKVSAHYLVDEDGTVFRLVDEARRAWHAGAACWAGATNINDRSVGVELVNPGHQFGYRPFPEAQMAALEELAGQVVARHAIPAARVLGHSDVAPERKRDPGELFDWARLARAGVGLWPEAAPVPPCPGNPGGAAEPDRTRAMLADFGYATEDLEMTVKAFQRHFRPARVDGELDADTLARLRWLAARVA